MISEKYSNVSLIGRIAYGMMCVEAYFKEKYPEKNWAIIMRDLWKITMLELWDDWMDKVIEIIPEYLFEFDDYASSDFEHLSKEEYSKLIELYKDTGKDVNDLLKKYIILQTNMRIHLLKVGELRVWKTWKK